MDDRKLNDIFNEKVIKEENIGDRNTFVMQLTAKVDNVAYYSQKIWIDTERSIPLTQELYAKSGQLLKRTELKGVTQIQGRWSPTTIVYKDMLKQGNGTEFKVNSILFDQKIPEYFFSKPALKQ